MRDKQGAAASTAELIAQTIASKVAGEGTALRTTHPVVLVAEGIAAPSVAATSSSIDSAIGAGGAAEPIDLLFDEDEDDHPPVAAGSKRKKGKGKALPRKSKATIGSGTDEDDVVIVVKRGCSAAAEADVPTKTTMFKQGQRSAVVCSLLCSATPLWY